MPNTLNIKVAMQTIKTKFLGETTHKPRRLKAQTSGGFTITRGLHLIESEMFSRGLPDRPESRSLIIAEELRDELGWRESMVCGSLSDDEFVWVFVKSFTMKEKGAA
jgi:hypothetical protein